MFETSKIPFCGKQACNVVDDSFKTELLEILQTFVTLGNTVVVIEHNLDVIKTADWIVDMGPDGGINGGKVIAEGTPEKVSQIDGSYTGSFLKGIINTRMKKTA